MKNRIALFVALLFVLGGPVLAGEPDYIIKFPDGWKKRTESAAPEHYMKNGTSMILTIDYAPAEAKTIDAYVEFVKKQYQKSFKSIQFEPVSKLTINGIDARELKYTADISGMKMKYDVAFIPRQSKVYTLTAGGMGDTFDALKVDCQAIFKSFKFK